MESRQHHSLDGSDSGVGSGGSSGSVVVRRRIAVIKCPSNVDNGVVIPRLFDTVCRGRWDSCVRFEFTVLEARQPDFAHRALKEPLFDGYVISGSSASVYDDAGWIRALEAVVKELCVVKQRPVIGLCFGHQMIARALGGHVERNPQGWGIGRRSFLMNDDAFTYLQSLRSRVLGTTKSSTATGEGATAPTATTTVTTTTRAMEEPVDKALALLYTHQDHVLVIPSGLLSMGGTDHAPVLGLYNKKNILTFQGHPEFFGGEVQPVFERLKEEQKKINVPLGETLETIRQTMSMPNHSSWIGECIAGLLYRPTMSAL